MLRSDKMTPYTSFASSSNASPDIGCTGAAGAAPGVGTRGSSSFRATMTPEVELSVLRGLLNGVVAPLSEVGGWGETARETAGRRPSFPAGLGRFVRCQSW